MNRAKRGLAALATAVLLAGYALAGLYWYGKISWSPFHLFYEEPVPGWSDFFGWMLAGMSWIFPAVVTALGLLHLAGKASSAQHCSLLQA
nr:hypothetical protein [uncultured Pseudomonas sp.]